MEKWGLNGHFKWIPCKFKLILSIYVYQPFPLGNKATPWSENRNKVKATWLYLKETYI